MFQILVIQFSARYLRLVLSLSLLPPAAAEVPGMGDDMEVGAAKRSAENQIIPDEKDDGDDNINGNLGAIALAASPIKAVQISCEAAVLTYYSDSCACSALR